MVGDTLCSGAFQILTIPDIDNPEALGKYYNLILSLTRVVTSVVLSRGPQNAQTLEQARLFLVENRPLVVAIFKLQAKVGAVTFESMGVNVDEISELFVLLLTVTEFLDVSCHVFCGDEGSFADFEQYEEKRDTQKRPKYGFS